VNPCVQTASICDVCTLNLLGFEKFALIFSCDTP
jgi:hypothetical protein